MGAADDLTGLLTQLTKADTDIGYRSGIVTEWNAGTGQNTIVVAGAPISNVPFLIRTEALAIRVGDVVGVLRVRSQYFVLGRISVNAGEIIVRDGDGDISVRLGRGPLGDPTLALYHPGSDVFAALFAGRMTFNGDDVGRGVVVEQTDGTDVLAISPEVTGGPATVRINDTAGEQAFATDDGAAGLLDRPHLDVPMYHNNSTGDIRITATSFQTVWMGRLRHTHPALHAQARIWVSSGDATLPTGQVRLMVNNTQVGSTESTSSTSTTFVDFGTSVHDLGSLGLTPYGWYQVELQARISANSGTGRRLSVFPYGITKRGTA